MDVTTPVLARAAYLVTDELYAHLEEAEFVATQPDDWSPADADQARKLIPDLVTVIHGLIVEHNAGPSGACPVCAVVWPCPVITTIHALVKDPNRQFAALMARADEDH